MTDTRTDLRAEAGGTGAQPKGTRRVEVNVGAGGQGADIASARAPGDEKGRK